MAKDKFLKFFQENICLEIQKLVSEEWGFEHLNVYSENKYLEGIFKGFIDISIEDEGNSKSLIAIEIEHRSSYKQAHQNIEKLKKWSHNSTYRKCGFLHLFNEACKISESQMATLIDNGKKIERKGLGFYYDYTFYKVVNRNHTKQIPADLVASKDFNTRLWKLLRDSDLI